jgi:hypothetical protein
MALSNYHCPNIANYSYLLIVVWGIKSTSNTLKNGMRYGYYLFFQTLKSYLAVTHPTANLVQKFCPQLINNAI